MSGRSSGSAGLGPPSSSTTSNPRKKKRQRRSGVFLKGRIHEDEAGLGLGMGMGSGQAVGTLPEEANEESEAVDVGKVDTMVRG